MPPHGIGTGAQGLRGNRNRCAIYTRKSSEEGLEQEFNSLDAQREACEAFVRSQKHEGWHALPQLYDDPGYSGGNMERPALKRLLIDIAAKKVDVVVVYKVDRLTRSLGCRNWRPKGLLRGSGFWIRNGAKIAGASGPRADEAGGWRRLGGESQMQQ